MITKPLSMTLWKRWIIFTVFGGTLGFTLGGFVLIQIENQVDYSHFNYYSPLYMLLLIAIAGLFIGLGQWMILRTRLKKTILWIPATTIGIPLGLFVGFWVSEILPGFIFVYYDWIVTLVQMVVAGVTIGTIQWIALHRKINGFFSWILSSVSSWGIGFIGGIFIIVTYLVNIDFGFFNYSIFGFIISITVGTISGAFINKSLLVSAIDRN